MGFKTDAIHAGQEPDPTTGAVTIPIYQTSTYVQEGLGKHKGFEYARTQNPTRTALEKNMAVLEAGCAGYAFASGMAAITALTQLLLKQDDHAVCTENVYGGTFRLFDTIVKNYGVEFTYVDTSNLGDLERAIRPNTRMVFVETPTNPLMVITDVRAVCDLAHRHNCRVVVDNTFMSPYFQRPLDLGADIVVHSTTKYLNGHSDSIGGVAVLKRKDDAARLEFIQNAAGAILSPFDSWLVLRGIKTLAVRMEGHNANGMAIAKYLAGRKDVQRVYYPGLANHTGHNLAKKQMSGFGGMIAFDLGSLDRAKRFLEAVKLCSFGESLGGVETLISHPATMTHASVPPEERARMGITDGLVRISVGIEDVEDLIADLQRAFEA
ncbi:MAG: cystathionine gamma-synthase [Acidobacteria bacterium 13_1_20CM_2_55_15]|nr:MAG: cystathionine gamma-synthase [Acidobacteria bacterium 13_1_40CM_56_16]OLD21234.1 MAG: cystathionine gamma-synthase [Acidobacteria bacterium 13_1_40CM_3_56_11]OLD68508.1 MAG: cystathionine gamma-synthase [Acidobacteria bacterium 13_1_40CM_2_56_11]OLE88926.1 MAG: cystathionine gamma-synthase [Acidobacteria bacterium 13_1_20CM_2_55_15]